MYVFIEYLVFKTLKLNFNIFLCKPHIKFRLKFSLHLLELLKRSSLTKYLDSKIVFKVFYRF